MFLCHLDLFMSFLLHLSYVFSFLNLRFRSLQLVIFSTTFLAVQSVTPLRLILFHTFSAFMEACLHKHLYKYITFTMCARFIGVFAFYIHCTLDSGISLIFHIDMNLLNLDIRYNIMLVPIEVPML